MCCKKRHLTSHPGTSDTKATAPTTRAHVTPGNSSDACIIGDESMQRPAWASHALSTFAYAQPSFATAENTRAWATPIRSSSEGTETFAMQHAGPRNPPPDCPLAVLVSSTHPTYTAKDGGAQYGHRILNIRQTQSSEHIHASP